MNINMINDYLKAIEDNSYACKLDLASHDVKEAYLKLTLINKVISELLYRLANEPTIRDIK